MENSNKFFKRELDRWSKVCSQASKNVKELNSFIGISERDYINKTTPIEYSIFCDYIDLFGWFNNKDDYISHQIFLHRSSLSILFKDIILILEYKMIYDLHKSVSRYEMNHLDSYVNLYKEIQHKFFMSKEEELNQVKANLTVFYKKIKFLCEVYFDVAVKVWEGGHREVPPEMQEFLSKEIFLTSIKTDRYSYKGNFGKVVTLESLKRALELGDFNEEIPGISIQTEEVPTLLNKKTFIDNETQSELKEFADQFTQIDSLDKVKTETLLSKSYRMLAVIKDFTKKIIDPESIKSFIENVEVKHEFYAERIKTANSLEELENSARLLDKEYEQIELIGQEFTENA